MSLRFAVARQDHHMHRHGGVEAEVRQAGLQPLPVGGGRHHVEAGVVLGHPEVVHHAVVGNLEPHLLDLLPGRRDLVIDDVLGQQALRRIAEGAHVAGVRVDLGVGGEGGAGHLAVEVPIAEGLHGVGIHGHGRGVFLHPEQQAAIEVGVGVGRAAIAPLHGRIVLERVAIGAEQGVAGVAFQLPLVGAAPALLEVHPAVLEAELADHAVAVEGDVVAQQRRELRVRLDAEEGAVDIGRHLAVDVQVVHIALDADRLEGAGEAGGVWELGHEGRFLPGWLGLDLGTDRPAS